MTEPSAEVLLGLSAILIPFLLALCQRLGRRPRPHRTCRPTGKSRRGTVYVYRDTNGAGIVKVGLTTRLCKVRKAEVSRTMADGSRLVQIFAIDNMPHLDQLERLVHGMLDHRKVQWGRGSRRGREWFHAAGPVEEEEVIQTVINAAFRIRQEAVEHGRWNPASDHSVQTWRREERGAVRRHLFRSLGSLR